MIGRREVAVVPRWQLRPSLYLLELMRALTAIILYLLVYLFLPHDIHHLGIRHILSHLSINLH
jgi:hypothetical protein